MKKKSDFYENSMRILIFSAGVIGGKYMKNEEYKKLSINEFTKAAGRYESNHAGTEMSGFQQEMWS